MKKAISITLNGVIFTIEEDAYEKLNKYLDSIKEYFKSPDEEKEILNDIESSIAEKFSAKINAKKKVINVEDVRGVIKVMGTVKEILEANGEQAKEIKEESKSTGRQKKLYRDPENGVLAGVCSGIAIYFNIDPVFIRLLFVALTFVDGIGVLAYLILWIVVPKAETNAQMLEMRGKPVNLAKLRQVIKNKSKTIKREGKEAISKHKNVIYRIINFPIMIINNIILLLRKILKKFWPVISILLGVIIVISMLFSIIGVSLALTALLFNINSPYIISDLPLGEFTHSLSYIIVVAAAYFVIIIPLILLLILGVTFINRKNAFRMIASSILIIIWMVAIVALGVAAIELAPRVKDRIDQIAQAETITISYELADFHSIRIGGQGEVKVTQGEEFSFKITAEEEVLPGMEYQIKEGELQVWEADRKKGICIFCFARPKTIEITMPELKSFIAHGRIKAEVSGFDTNLKINAGESARIKAYVNDHALTSYIAGTDGRIEIIGSPDTLKVTLEGAGRLTALKLDTREIYVNPAIFSRVTLGGTTDELTIEAENSARVYASDLRAEKVSAKAEGHSKVEVRATNTLNAIAQNHGIITYKGNPVELIKKTTGGGIIKKSRDLELYELEEDMEVFEHEIDDLGKHIKFEIKADVNSYAPFMSSVRGIGLSPELEEEINDRKIKYFWQTNLGSLVEDWNEIDYVREIENEGEKIYWTYLFDNIDIEEKPNIFISVNARDQENNQSLGEARIELEWGENGLVMVKE